VGDIDDWAASGAMALTGPAGRPLGPPEGLVARLRELVRPFDVDPLALLAERAAVAGFTRRGSQSCGGGTRLLRTTDGWVALSLARRDDVDAVPALVQCDDVTDPWAAAATYAARMRAADVVERGRLLGLPIAALGERPARDVVDAVVGPAASRPLRGVVVAELGALWAAPLCGALLRDAGAEVIKVESTSRPDGARNGPPAFFDLLNAGKSSFAIDLATPDGAAALRMLLTKVDVVIESSRPRALEQLGIDATALLATDGGPTVWASITGHGRDAPTRDWVAFGDDAAVAGGLVAWDGDDPCFCVDAIADPIAGLRTAGAIVDALAGGGRHLLDVSMAGLAATLAGPTLPITHPVDAALPRARTPAGPGPALGAHTAAIAARFGLWRT
jgi:hypothetical protein